MTAKSKEYTGEQGRFMPPPARGNNNSFQNIITDL